MAGKKEASALDASPAGFGAWLRERREEKGALLRVMAAAADMDPSHLGKAERGERLPAWDKAVALARALDMDSAEMKSRYAAAKLWRDCGGDAGVAAGAASLVQEHASAYIVNKPANNRPNKK